MLCLSKIDALIENNVANHKHLLENEHKLWYIIDTTFVF